MKPSPPKATGKGEIQKGDKYGYMGHYREGETMKRGHNQGAPGGGLNMAHPALNPISNPQGFGQFMRGAGTPQTQTGTGGVSPSAPVGGGGPTSARRPRMVKESGGGMQTPFATPAGEGAFGPGPGAPPPTLPSIGSQQGTLTARQGLQQGIGNLRNARQQMQTAVSGRGKRVRNTAPKRSARGNRQQPGGY